MSDVRLRGIPMTTKGALTEAQKETLRVLYKRRAQAVKVYNAAVAELGNIDAEIHAVAP